MDLGKYQKKRDFDRTREPRGKTSKSTSGNLYVIQKHAARRLHYDLRLELGGTLKSWAVPKGPSVKPGERRLAVHVEDHPIEYGRFEGEIPKGEYGAGKVEVWDIGTWEPEADPFKGYKKGHLSFVLHGRRLRGKWNLVRMHTNDKDGDKNWLLIKSKDDAMTSSSDGNAMQAAPVAAVVTTATAQELARLSGARKRPMPRQFAPQLATLVTAAPPGEEWLHEVKWDGYRILARVQNGRARLITRNGKDWTKKLGDLVEAVAALSADEAIVDGELVALNDKGISDFQALQNALHSESRAPLTYYVFDLPYCNGFDLTQVALQQRKEALAVLVDRLPKKYGKVIRYSEHIVGAGAEVYTKACDSRLEGIIAKQAQSHYEQRRSRNWLKVKCSRSQEFIIGGFTDPGGTRRGLGALLIGLRESDALAYAGKVGTGFDSKSLVSLRRRLQSLERRSSPFHNPPRGAEVRGVHWVEPSLVGEISFTQWTKDKLLRHPVFNGLREDKPAAQVHLERAQKPPSTSARKAAKSAGEASLTHPDKILFADQGITKQELADYYLRVADMILPHIEGRPLMVLRCPEGSQKNCFYQKHVQDAAAPPPGLQSVPIRFSEGIKHSLLLKDADGLLALVQMGALEIHPWGSRAENLEHPDRLIFDLDPGPGVAWKEVIDTGFLLRDNLQALGLKSFAKLSGGKGLHIVLPVQPKLDWEEAKMFTRAVAQGIAQAYPQRFVATVSKAKRHGKIFIDYLRNSRGATAVAPYSTRARSGAPVAIPISWEELRTARGPDQFDIAATLKRLRSKRDPWAGFFKVRQTPRLK